MCGSQITSICLSAPIKTHCYGRILVGRFPKGRNKTITAYEAPYELVRTMRASFLVMGPLLARVGKARISMPGGCAIGARPIDIHLKAFEALGVKIEQGHGYIDATAPNGLKGTNIYFDFPSVGATENVLMAAS